MKNTALTLFLVLSAFAFAGVVNEGVVPGKPFVRYTAQTSARTIAFYVSEHPATGKPLPLVVWVQGTGCGSHFVRGDDGRVLGSLVQIVRDAAANHAVVMAVDKPGVKYLDPEPERLEECRSDFLRDYTLDSWADAIAGAIEATRTLPSIDSSRVLVMGHSEGGIVAMRVSNVARDVKYAAALSGGGQLIILHT